LGHNIRDEDELISAKERIGYLPSNPAFDESVTGQAILDLHASIKGDERREELLDIFDPPLDRKVREYSTGNVQKLGLLQAFMHNPDVVIMDEPTSGLDPLMQQRFNEFIRDEKEKGTTIFFSSHILSEVRRVCDRVGILRDGRLVTTEDIEGLLNRSGKFVRARVADSVEVEGVNIGGVHDVKINAIREERGQQEITELTFTYTGDINELLNLLSDHTLLDLDVEEAPLEEVFMRFYGGEQDV
ncbi:MAG: ABC transporter ATP-binding protein, partial [Halobacteria archaeon]|nr:ABC transporter ATP-binding protein [Halobacteria archaeon]